MFFLLSGGLIRDDGFSGCGDPLNPAALEIVAATIGGGVFVGGGEPEASAFVAVAAVFSEDGAVHAVGSGLRIEVDVAFVETVEPPDPVRCSEFSAGGPSQRAGGSAEVEVLLGDQPVRFPRPGRGARHEPAWDWPVKYLTNTEEAARSAGTQNLPKSRRGRINPKK